MNKLVIALVVIALLGGGVLFLTKKSANPTVAPTPTSTDYQSNTYQSSPSPASTSAPATTTSKTQLDAELNQELNQLDKDVTSGSKEDVTDSDMNFN